ncbi:site-2 protease family protein [Streptomyces sp. NPDC005820]|uniref:site-2 protease family protein n=1 Tax=Streptomyces sp. NPDC005820 TaxID=3157069 RepID=UPI003403ECB3
MVESGGSGRPRPDNEESAEHPVTPAPQATAPEPEGPAPSTPPTEPAPAPSEGQRSGAEPPSDASAPEAQPSNGRAEGEQPSAERTGDAESPDTPTADAPPAAAPTTDAPTTDAPTTDAPLTAAPTTDAPPTAAPPSASAPTEPPAAPAPQSPDAGGAGHDARAAAPGDEPASHDVPPTTPAPPHPTQNSDHVRAHAHAHAHDSGAAQPPAPVGIKGPPPQRPPEQPRGGLLMGRPFGVPVYVAPSWFLVAALITWVFGGQLDRVLPELGAARYLVSLFFAVAFYASVLIHELAHTIAALRFKLPVRRIQLQFFGGVSEIEKEAETPGREFWLAFVGPLLSLVLAGVFYAAMQPVEPGTVPGVLLAGLMISNLIVAVFNLLPGLPLDGGRMLRAVVWKITGKPMTGTIAAAWVGRALAVSVLIGLPLLTQSGALGSSAEDSVGMDTVTDALLAAILAAIIWTGAGNSLRMARLREHLPELRARTLTRRAVPVETDTPLSEALRRANAAGARALVVVDAHGEPLSLVREAAIVGVPEHRRPWVAVSGLAQDLTDGMRVSAELAGEDLLDVLRATPATEYLVVEETGEIYGVLSAADVERAFVKAMARPS